MKNVILNGNPVDFDACVNLMDDELREGIAAEGIDDEQEFIELYCYDHYMKYGEQFTVN